MNYKVRVNLSEKHIYPTLITIFDQTGREIKKLFENYNEECKNQKFYGSFGKYLTSKNIEWEALDFDIDLMP